MAQRKAIDDDLIYTFCIPERDVCGLSALDSNVTGWSDRLNCKIKLPRFTIQHQPIPAGGDSPALAGIAPIVGVRAPYIITRANFVIERVTDAAGSVAPVPPVVEFIITGGLGCIQNDITPMLTYTPDSHDGEFLVQISGRTWNQVQLYARIRADQAAQGTTWNMRVVLDRFNTPPNAVPGAVALDLQLGPNVA